MDSVTLTLPTAPLERALAQLINTMQREADRIVAETAVAALDEIVSTWPVDTGVSRAAWSGPHQMGPAHYELRNNISYAPVIEYGGWKGIGPKTVPGGGFTLPGDMTVAAGIFSSQVPEAPVRRALSNHRDDITEGLRQLLHTTWGS